MNLLRVFLQILQLWRGAFKKDECFTRAVHHALAGVCSGGRGTITQIITNLGRSDQDWTSDYKLYSKRTWEAKDLFQPIVQQAISFSNKHFIAVAADDTKLRKTGKKIPTASWQRDPMGPPFQTNLIWAQRFLQFSALLPLYEVFSDVPPRSLPIRFSEAPSVKKPGKKALAEEINAYREAKKEHNLSTLFVRQVYEVRAAVDKAGAADQKVLMVVDNSFCNRTTFKENFDRVELLARCRKDAKLCFRSPLGSRRFYDPNVFSPEQVRLNPNIAWKAISIFHGGTTREVQYKEISQVLWRGGAGRKPLRLFVLRPIRYRLTKNARANYRDPAYLLTTDMDSPAEAQIQAYFDRWQIEVNHREEKSLIGVGQAQVRNRQSIHRQPALMVAAYSALLLASVVAYNDGKDAATLHKPKWYQKVKRPSCRRLIMQIRKELVEMPELQQACGSNINVENMCIKAAP